jgi:hypothetical protein
MTIESSQRDMIVMRAIRPLNMRTIIRNIVGIDKTNENKPRR